jgi:hypothetical protein
VSFRSGAVVAGGLLTAAGVAITLAVVLGGHSDSVASAPASRAAVPSTVRPVLAPVSSSPPATPPSATPRASRTTSPATVAGTYQPGPALARQTPAGRPPDALEPGFHCVRTMARTDWNQAFTASERLGTGVSWRSGWPGSLRS